MTRSASALFTTVALFALASRADAQQDNPKAFEFVGVSATLVTGARGILDMSRACQEIWAQSRMCTSEEVMSTVTMPAGHAEAAWVRPVWAPFAYASGSISFNRAMDASGAQAPGELTCSQWSSDVSGHGLTVSPSGALTDQPCSDARPVACCMLIPVPEPPLTLMQGAGAAGFAAMAMSRRPSLAATPSCSRPRGSSQLA